MERSWKPPCSSPRSPAGWHYHSVSLFSSMLEHDRPCGMLGTWYPTKTSFENPPRSLIPAVSVTVQYAHGTFALNHSLLSPQKPKGKKAQHRRCFQSVRREKCGWDCSDICLLYSHVRYPSVWLAWFLFFRSRLVRGRPPADSCESKLFPHAEP